MLTGWSEAPGEWPAEDRARVARYAANERFAAGEQWGGRARRNEPRLTLNYARALIRKTASYCFPAPVRFNVDPPTPEAAGRASAAERLLNDVIDRLDLGQLDLDLAIESATLGDAALKITWDASEQQPRVAAVHPGSLRATAAPDDPRRILAVEHRYTLDRAGAEALFGESARLLGSEPVETREYWTAERWTLTLGGQVVRDEANPYGWIPYLVLANDPPAHALWGVSDLEDLSELCQELNRRMSVLARVLELSGAPIAVLENVDSAEGIVVGPGATWELPEGAKAYLLDLLGGGGVGLHVQYVDLIYRALHDLSETPRTAFGDSGRMLSGAALEVEIQPLVQRVRRRRRRWDELYRARNARLLDLLERFGGAEIGGLRQSSAIWPPVLPSDTDATARTAALLVGQGIASKRTALATLGFADPELELKRVEEELALVSRSERGATIEVK
jgi:hypothetical protein